jgi:WhiB family redox-sensing transcriptional regulator
MIEKHRPLRGVGATRTNYAPVAGTGTPAVAAGRTQPRPGGHARKQLPVAEAKALVAEALPTPEPRPMNRVEQAIARNRTAPPVVADLLGNAPEWQERALCSQTDPEAFFPEKGGSTQDAKRICARCEVRSDCLEYALVHHETFGIWGGLSERERRKLKRRAG